MPKRHSRPSHSVASPPQRLPYDPCLSDRRRVKATSRYSLQKSSILPPGVSLMPLPLRQLAILLAVISVTHSYCLAQQTAIGLFQHHADIGDVMKSGSVEYDAKTKSYTIAGGGENMWATRDALHFVWKPRIRRRLAGRGYTLPRHRGRPASQGLPYPSRKPGTRLTVCRCRDPWRWPDVAAVSGNARRPNARDPVKHCETQTHPHRKTR